jgi:DNA-binding response OmpR family regulator
MKLLLVEDNPLTAKGLQYLLEREHYDVDVASSLAEAEANLAMYTYKLVLLDVGLPDGDGFALTETLRRQSKTAIIFLTAKDDEADVVRGLELGAEDYITKPFRNRELLLRIQKALRPQAASVQKVTVGALSLDHTGTSVSVAGNEITLSAVERRLLSRLVENIGQVVTREQLLDEIYDASGSIVNDNTLSVYLKRLRKKLGPSVTIETIKSVGYRLRGETNT